MPCREGERPREPRATNIREGERPREPNAAPALHHAARPTGLGPREDSRRRSARLLVSFQVALAALGLAMAGGRPGEASHRRQPTVLKAPLRVEGRRGKPPLTIEEGAHGAILHRPGTMMDGSGQPIFAVGEALQADGVLLRGWQVYDARGVRAACAGQNQGNIGRGTCCFDESGTIAPGAGRLSGWAGEPPTGQGLLSCDSSRQVVVAAGAIDHEDDGGLALLYGAGRILVEAGTEGPGGFMKWSSSLGNLAGELRTDPFGSGNTTIRCRNGDLIAGARPIAGPMGYNGRLFSRFSDGTEVTLP